MVSSMIEVYVCVCGRGGGDQQFSVYYLFILNFPTLNCLQFKPKLFSFVLLHTNMQVLKGNS